MEMLKAALTVSPADKAQFEKEERQRERKVARDEERKKGAAPRIAAAEAKRERRIQRNRRLEYCGN